MAEWPGHRQRASRRTAIVSLAAPLLIVAIAASWWLQSHVGSESGADHPTTDVRRWLSPDLYGSRSTSADSGERRLVDSPDSAGPVVLVVGSPGTTTADWSSVQALLERHGIGSVAVVPRGKNWTVVIRSTVDSLGARATVAGRAVAAITFGRGLDSLVAAADRRPDLASWRLVAIAPGIPARTAWAKALARFPRWIRPMPDTADLRLARWRGDVLVATSADDPSFDFAAARRVAPPGGQMLATSVARSDDAPRHPSDDDWRGVIDFIRGSATRQDVVFPAAIDSVMPASAVATPPPPSHTQPLPQRRRR